MTNSVIRSFSELKTLTATWNFATFPKIYLGTFVHLWRHCFDTPKWPKMYLAIATLQLHAFTWNLPWLLLYWSSIWIFIFFLKWRISWWRHHFFEIHEKKKNIAIQFESWKLFQTYWALLSRWTSPENFIQIGRHGVILDLDPHFPPLDPKSEKWWRHQNDDVINIF